MALPIDVIEGYLWGREWVISTYKHPALPSWMLEASRVLTGHIGWPAYLVSQLFIAATLALIYILGRDLMDARRGAAAALLMTGVFFFSWFSPEFNHNIAQMPFWIGFVWALWRATHEASTGRWIVVALFATACVYTKLSCGVLLAVGALWVLWDARTRRQLVTPRPWIAAGVFLVLTSPLLIWLVQHSFQPLDYAERRATSSGAVDLPEFVLGQLGRHAVMIVMLAYAGLLWNSKRPEVEPGYAPPIERSARNYLLVMAIGPLLLLIGASLAMGMQLKPAWTASMSTLSGVVALALLSHRFSSWTFARLIRVSILVMIATVAAYGYDSLTGPRDKDRYRPQQAAWPAREIAQRGLAAWAKATSAPLRIVVGETRVAGLVALYAPTLPSLYTEADLWRAPWITQDRIDREGMLLVWAEPGGVAPARMYALAGNSPVDIVQIKWPRAPNKPPLNLRLAVIPPKAVATKP